MTAQNKDQTWQDIVRKSQSAFKKGNYQKAENWAVEALNLAQGTDNNEHIAISLHNLATIKMALHKYRESERLLYESLAIKEKESSEDFATLAATYNQLAQLYRRSGRLNDAEQLFKKVLSIIENVDDRKTKSIVLSNLGSVYVNQDRFSEAEALFREALEIQRSLKDPKVSTTLNNLGGLYLRRGRLKEAESNFREAIKISESTLGVDHPDRPYLFANLVRVLTLGKKTEEYGSLIEEAKKTFQKAVEQNHPSKKEFDRLIKKWEQLKDAPNNRVPKNRS